MTCAGFVTMFGASACGGPDASPDPGSGIISNDPANPQTESPLSPDSPGVPCPSYANDFLPMVHDPVCSHCHASGSRLPDWGVYATAKAGCGRIGSYVSSGAMPPAGSGLTLSAAQKTLVANWVHAGCPQTAADATAACGSAPNPTATPTTGTGTGGAATAPTTTPPEPNEGSEPEGK